MSTTCHWEEGCGIVVDDDDDDDDKDGDEVGACV
jgi:hypothetical protein